MRACRTFALSRVAYGWLARSLTLTLCKQLWSNVHVGSRRIRAASIWLRAALWGGVLHLDVLFAVHLVGVLSRIQSRRPLVWSVVGGTPARALSMWLTCHGWRLVRPWVWYHDLTDSHLNFGVNEEVGLRQHIVRNAWRAWCLLVSLSTCCFQSEGSWYWLLFRSVFSSHWLEKDAAICGVLPWSEVGVLWRFFFAFCTWGPLRKLSYYGLCLGRLFMSWHLGPYCVGVS